MKQRSAVPVLLSSLVAVMCLLAPAGSAKTALPPQELLTCTQLGGTIPGPETDSCTEFGTTFQCCNFRTFPFCQLVNCVTTVCITEGDRSFDFTIDQECFLV